MREGTTSRVMAADRPYGEFYDFYSVNLLVNMKTFMYLYANRLSSLHEAKQAIYKTGYKQNRLYTKQAIYASHYRLSRALTAK
jgi:hypothetical protein